MNYELTFGDDSHICGALHDLVPFVQFKKREKHPWRSVNFQPTTLLKYFTKLYKWYQIAQRITFFKPLNIIISCEFPKTNLLGGWVTQK